jgi:hypothetical protein
METTQRSSSKAIYTVVERANDRPFWLRIGWAHTNRDGSLSMKLDALPIDGRLQVRDWNPREQDAGPREGEAGPTRAAPPPERRAASSA